MLAHPRHTAVVFITVAVNLTLGCGSSRGSDIPPELLAAIAAGQNQGGGDYPSGPYGPLEGDVAANLCFQGWPDPEADDYDGDQMQQVCFADFYDPSGEEIRLLYVATSALWCVACVNEYGGGPDRPSLREHFEARRDDGFRVLGALFQDTARNPASVADAEIWASRFEVNFAFVRDNEFRMGEFANANNQPFGMLVDTATMRIVAQFEGDVPASLWPAVDDFLDTN